MAEADAGTEDAAEKQMAGKEVTRVVQVAMF